MLWLYFLHIGRIIGSAAGAPAWRRAGEAGALILETNPPACEDVFPNEIGSGPALLPNAVSQKQRRYFKRANLLKRHRRTRMQAAHPAYHILGEGNVEGTRKLGDFVKDMPWLDASNASFVFDSDARIGRSVRLKGLPSELRSNSKRVFSLGGDGAGLALHTHGATFLTLIYGQKLWLVAPPDAKLAPALRESVHGHGLKLKRAVDAIDEAQPAGTLTPASGITQCLQSPGTALYLPSDWFHATVNVGDAIAIGVQSLSRSNIFADVAAAAGEDEMSNNTFNEALATGTADQLLAGLLWLKDPGWALRAAERVLELNERDLRPHFYITQILASAFHDIRGATQQMDTCRKAAIAMGKEADPPTPKLVAMWLLRVAYTLCGPLQDVQGAEVVKEALDWDADALKEHALAQDLQSCLEAAEDTTTDRSEL